MKKKIVVSYSSTGFTSEGGGLTCVLQFPNGMMIQSPLNASSVFTKEHFNLPYLKNEENYQLLLEEYPHLVVSENIEIDRKKAKSILFNELKIQGSEEVLFPDGKKNHNSGLIETVIDAMVKFKELK